MSAPWQNNAAPGFVYFSPQQNYQNKNDRSDFLSFDDSQGQQNPFWPNMCSSPQKNHKSPRNFKQRNKFQRYSAPSFNRSNNSSNNSFNTSNNSPRKWDKRNSNDGQSNPQDGMWRYFEPSCLKNPWEQLERQQELQEKQELEQNKQTTNQDNENSNDSSSSSSSSRSENENQDIAKV